MKQFQIEYKNTDNLQYEMAKILKNCMRMTYSSVVFQVYVHSEDKSVVTEIKETIKASFPNASICGLECYSLISMGCSSDALAIIDCTIYEYESTKSEVLLIDKDNPLYEEYLPNSILVNTVRKYPWVKSIEILATKNVAQSFLTPELKVDIKDVKICGGVASNAAKIASDETFVFANDDISDEAIVLRLTGGEDYHFECTFVTGWRALGKSMKITECTGTVIKKIDDEPALNVYTKYFNITNSDNFTNEAVVFPLLIDKNGVGCLVAPLATNDDGELIMGAKCKVNDKVRISYGTPGTIIDDIKKYGQIIVDFTPDVIRAYSCYGRLSFLKENIDNETQILDSIAPTAGFYGAGQYLLLNNYLYLFNYCIVAAASREGEAMDLGLNISNVQTNYKDTSFMSKLVKYITVSSAELEEYNQKITKMAITDGLTGLYNRKEIQRRIEVDTAECQKNMNRNTLHLMMFDIDNFKMVNDTYGHKKGDEVIIKICEIIKEKVKDYPNCSAGRWGGEEFMISLPNIKREEVLNLAEEIRKELEDFDFGEIGHKTTSVGVCQLNSSDTPESIAIAVDRALYHVKMTTKNAVYELVDRD